MKSRHFFLPLILLALTHCAHADLEVPYLTGRVNDNAGILSDDSKWTLGETLKAHETHYGNQIAILTIPSLEGENIEDYAVRVFTAWKLGQKGVDNGVLILVAPNDRRMRIEVGYGLEPTLTDGMAGQIIRSTMTPKFKNNDYDGGILDGTREVISVLEGGTLTETAQEEDSENSGGQLFEGPNLGFMERILIGAFIFGIIGLFTVIGILTPGVGWFLYFFLIPFWAMFPIVVVGTKGAFILLLIYFVGFPVAKIRLRKTAWYQKARKDLRTKGKASIGGFVFTTGGSSRSGSSWSSSSSSGGSSFSGGGGSSGGGGASGSW